MARKTTTYNLDWTWICLNPNGEETVILQGVGTSNIRIAMADDSADLLEDATDPDNIIPAEDGIAMNRDTGLGTAFYGLSTKLWARLEGSGATHRANKSTLSVIAY